MEFSATNRGAVEVISHHKARHNAGDAQAQQHGQRQSSSGSDEIPCPHKKVAQVNGQPAEEKPACTALFENQKNDCGDQKGNEASQPNPECQPDLASGR
ncbi:hypothetical protein D3C87_1898660 [compost metagenome]